jgi:hypothetical protein
MIVISSVIGICDNQYGPKPKRFICSKRVINRRDEALAHLHVVVRMVIVGRNFSLPSLMVVVVGLDKTRGRIKRAPFGLMSAPQPSEQSLVFEPRPDRECLLA